MKHSKRGKNITFSLVYFLACFNCTVPCTTGQMRQRTKKNPLCSTRKWRCCFFGIFFTDRLCTVFFPIFGRFAESRYPIVHRRFLQTFYHHSHCAHKKCIIYNICGTRYNFCMLYILLLYTMLHNITI